MFDVQRCHDTAQPLCLSRKACAGAIGAVNFRRVTWNRRDPVPCGGLRRLPALDLPSNQLSTMRCQAGILMDVDPILEESLKLRNSSFLAQDRMDNLLKAHS
jgi:hypothetical protein